MVQLFRLRPALVLLGSYSFQLTPPHKMQTDIELALADLDRVAAANRQVKKARATWSKYLRAQKAGRATPEQMEAARSVLRESVRESLEMAFESGMGLGSFQGSNLGESLASDLIR